MRAWTRRSVGAGGLASALAFAASAAADDTYPFWQVRSGDATIYLMGDGGAVTPTWRSERIERALAGCGSFLRGEAPGALGPEATATLIAAGTNSARPLSTWLTPAQQRRVSDAAARVGATYERIAPFEPWLASGALGMFNAQRVVSAPGPGPVLNRAAAAQGKRIWTELPDADAYLDFWTGFSRAAQVEQLMFTVEQIEAGASGHAGAAAAYASGDLSLELERVAREARVYPHMYEAHLATRNRRWPPRIRSIVRSGGSSFVFVGADHLFGPEGVLALLAADGMTAQRI